MASSDSTGFHDAGWKFHQYSSSGGVLEASSESVLQMNEGSRVEGVLTLGSTAVLRELQQQAFVTTGGTLVEGFNSITLTTATSDASFALPAPAQGKVVEISVIGATSNVFGIYSNTSGVSVNKTTTYFGVLSDSDANIATFGLNYKFTSTGTAIWRLAKLNPTSQTAMSTALA